MKLAKTYNYKQIILVLFLVVFLFFILFIIYQDYNRQLIIDSVAADLKLKSPKEKIVSFTEYPGQNGQEDIVQYIYGTTKEAPADNYQGLTEDMSKRTPSSQSFIKAIKKIDADQEQITYVGKFYTGSSFYQDENNNWFYTEVATTTKTAFLKQTATTNLDEVKNFLGQPVFATVETTYSGGGDGYVQSPDIADSDWPTQHDATIGSTVDYTNITMINYVRHSSGDYTINRIFMPFDTSALPDTVAVTAATLNVKPALRFDQDNDGNDFITVVQTTQASNTSLISADYDQCGAISNPTEGIDIGERKDLTAISTGVYLTFALNATGISWISKTGYTNLGLREGHDVLNSAITDTLLNGLSIYTFEADGSNDPYLEITYSVFSRVKIDGGKIKIDGGKLKLN